MSSNMPQSTLAMCLLGTMTLAGVFSEPIVYTPGKEGTYRGIISNSVEYFQNIKYAHDTSGQRRFAPPEPFAYPSGSVVDASSPGPACPQLQDAMPPFFSPVQEISEDCLNLRIARPANLSLTPGSKLPVVVWLHGGGVVKGSAYDPHFEPGNLVRLSASDGQPVIYVALNYRVSIFGFARLPVLRDRKALNLGMRDQRAGFQWVRDNIEAFGGDPERITAFGLSAGGTFISLQLLAYGGERGVPFQRAWMMSGPPGTALNMTSDATTQHTLAVAERLGCARREDWDILECLRKIPMRDLLDAAMDYSIANRPPAGLFTFIPSLDDDLLPDSQSKLISTGRFVKEIPMVFGWTQDDGAINAGPGDLIQAEEDMIAPIKSFAHALSEEQLSDLFKLYPPSDFQEELDKYGARKGVEDPDMSVHYFRLSRILRDSLFTCSSIEFSRQMVKQTHDPDFSNARLYVLNQSVLAPIWKGAGVPYIGVSHGSDTNYIFNGVFPEGSLEDGDRELSEAVARSFINFAYTGDPNAECSSQSRAAEWPTAWTLDDGKSSLDLNIQVIGGPYGTGPAALSERSDESEETIISKDSLGSGKMQEVLMDDFKFGRMMSSADQTRKRLIQQEKLPQRCAYINSLSETLGI